MLSTIFFLNIFCSRLNTGMQSQWIQRANCKSACMKMDKMGLGCRYCQWTPGLPGCKHCFLATLLPSWPHAPGLHLSLSLSLLPKWWWYSDTDMVGFSSNQTHHLVFGYTLLGLLISRTALAGVMVPYLGSDAVMQWCSDAGDTSVSGARMTLETKSSTRSSGSLFCQGTHRFSSKHAAPGEPCWSPQRWYPCRGTRQSQG